MKPLTQEENDSVVIAKLKTCQRILISATENDPTLLTYDAWQAALMAVGTMITKKCGRILIEEKNKNTSRKLCQPTNQQMTK